jgi:serine/threonine protein kinase
LFFRSFSYVFEARDTADNHRYAIKKMSCHTNEEEKRARDEIENYQRFSHTNLGLIRNYILYHHHCFFVVPLLYYEQMQYDPNAHVTSIVWLVFPYFKVNYSFYSSNLNENYNIYSVEWISSRCF